MGSTERRSRSSGHPIRVGGLENNTTYAVLFEFDKSSMQVRTLNRQAGGPLGGEAMTPTMIDLPKVVQRVYVPKNKMDDALVRLRKIFGHDRFEVLPIETLSDYTGSKHLRGSMDSTLSAIEGIDRQTDELLKSMHQKLMAP